MSDGLAMPIRKRTADGRPNALAFPKRPDETIREWRRRWREFRRQGQQQLGDQENREQEGLRLFCEQDMDLGEVAGKLGGDYSWWVRKHLAGNWELLRANYRASKVLAGGEQRLLVAKRIDGVVLGQVEQVVREAGDMYLRMIGRIGKLPEELSEMTEADAVALKEDDDEGVSERSGTGTLATTGGAAKGRPGPKKSRTVLLRNKLELLNKAVGGIMDMANKARMLGLVMIPEGPADEKPANTNEQSEALADKIKGLNLVLLLASEGKPIGQRPRERRVLEAAGEHS